MKNIHKKYPENANFKTITIIQYDLSEKIHLFKIRKSVLKIQVTPPPLKYLTLIFPF